MNILKKLLNKNPQKTELTREEYFQKEKETATQQGKSWVAVLDTHVNENNIKNGFFELDWNDLFIEQLMNEGFTGSTQEEIVEKWFKSVISQIMDEEGFSSDVDMGFLNIKDFK